MELTIYLENIIWKVSLNLGRINSGWQRSCLELIPGVLSSAQLSVGHLEIIIANKLGNTQFSSHVLHVMSSTDLFVDPCHVLMLTPLWEHVPELSVLMARPHQPRPGSAVSGWPLGRPVAEQGGHGRPPLRLPPHLTTARGHNIPALVTTLPMVMVAGLHWEPALP